MIALIATLMLTGCWVWVNRKTQPGWAVFVALALVWLAVMGLDPTHFVQSHHGMMHSALVAGIVEQGFPPESPWFAGQPAGYPWGHHVLLAGLEHLGAPTPLGFTVTHAIALAGVWAALSFAAGGGRAGAAAVFVALLATSPIELEPRAVPLFVKFLNANSTPLGLATAAMFVAWLKHPQHHWLVVISVAAGGILYPLVGLGTALGAGAVIAMGQVPSRSRSMTALAAGSLLPAGYLIWMWSEGVGGSLSLVGWWTFGRHVVLGGMTAFPLLLLAWRGKMSRNSWVSIIVFCSLYLFFKAPADTEYKFLMVGLLIAVPAASRALCTMKTAGVLLMAAMVFPMALEIQRHTNPSPPARVALAGNTLLPVEPAERQLAEWVRTQPENVVLVDSKRDLSVTGRRSLFVSLADTPQPGWGMRSVDISVTLEGHSKEEWMARRGMAEALLAGQWSPEIFNEVGERPVLVVLREDRTVWPGLPRVFSGEAAQVVRLDP